MKWGIFVSFVRIPKRLPRIAVERIKKGSSIKARWKEILNPRLFPPSHGKIISLKLPIIIEPVNPIRSAGKILFLYL